MRIIYHNMQLHHEKILPLHNTNLTVITKNNEFYDYKNDLVSKYNINPLGYSPVYMKFKHREGNKKDIIFAFIQTEKGLYVSNQVSQDLKPSDRLYKSLSLLLGIEYETKEKHFLENIEDVFRFSPDYYDSEFKKGKGAKISLTLSNRGTRKAFKTNYEKISGKELKHNVATLRPDLMLIRNNKTTLIEGERTFHKENDYELKLLKLHGLQNKVSKIYMVYNGEKNMEYHTELIYNFEKKYNKKFHNKLFYTTYHDLMEKGIESFILYK